MKRGIFIAGALVLVVAGVMVLREYRGRSRQLSHEERMRLFFPMPARSPITVALVSQTNEIDGSRLATFCMSNRSAVAVEYLGDGTSIPYYQLLEYFPRNAMGFSAVTNHNRERFRRARAATVQPGGSAKFPVRIPAGLTGEVILINYLPRKGPFDKVEHLVERLRGKRDTSGDYVNFPVREPFESVWKP
jgi:hypothetical protein